MNEHTITQLPNSRLAIKFTVTPEEAKPYIDQALADITANKPIKGFRPGKAGYEDVKREYGEMLIWETALERIVRARYVKAVLDDGIETVGSPEISVEKLVPNQDIAFTATANIMPQVVNLADYSKPLAEKKMKKVGEEEVTKALDELRTMRRTEAAVARPANIEDMVLVDLDILNGGVILEGGSTRDYKVYLKEDHYIPGFAKKLEAAKKDDVLNFDLEFPKDHYNKQLAGKPTNFKVTVKDVFELKLPDLDDGFAKSLGVESMEKLKELMRDNLQHEADHRSQDSADIELLEKMVKGSKFSDIPDLMVNEEVRRMLNELETTVADRGMKMEDYLSSIKRNMEQLKLDFVPRAMDRIRTALVIKEVGKREQIEVGQEELDAEIDRLLSGIKESDKQTRDMVTSPDYREYLAVQLKNRKTLETLRKKAIKEQTT